MPRVPAISVSTDAAATQAHVRRSTEIVEMAERGGALKDLAAKQALDSELRHPDEAGKFVPDADAEAVRQAVRTPGTI